jgi:branched-chain amino acid transport system ATP-binding protein
MNGLAVDRLNAWYGKAQALYDVTISVPGSTVVGLIGRNGAGKTTTLRAIARVHRKISGSVSLEGRDIASAASFRAARAGVSLVGETAPTFTKMKVEENLRAAQLLAKRRRVTPRPVTDVWDWFPALYDLRHHPAGVLSGGQRRMLALSQAFVSGPRLLLLDEPSAGLSDDMSQIVFGVIRAVCEAGMTALISEQRPELIEAFVPRVYVLDEGVVVEEIGADRAAKATGAGREQLTDEH